MRGLTNKDKKPKLLDPQPAIKSFQPIVIPQQTVAGMSMVVQVFGLGEDGKIYIWSGDLHGWIET